MSWIETLKTRARELKRETYTLYLACRDPRVPVHVKVMGAFVVAYAFSPIDLIPDFIPILGYLDDLILVPLGIAMVVRMVPPTVLEDCRKDAEELMRAGKPVNKVAGVVIVCIWLCLAAFIVAAVLRMLHR